MKPQNIKSFSSLIPSYLFIVTKFLNKISQFEFLVMTEKNIFDYKLFLSLNISDFIFYVKIATPSWDPVKLPLFENLAAGSTLPTERGGGRAAHYDVVARL